MGQIPTLLLKKKAPKVGGCSRGCRGDRGSKEYRADIVSLTRLTGLTRLAGITGLTELTEQTVPKLKMLGSTSNQPNVDADAYHWYQYVGGRSENYLRISRLH